MSDYDRNKFYPKKKLFGARDSGSNYNRFFNAKDGTSKSNKESTKENSASNETTPKKQPTILIKAREPTGEDVVALPKRSQKEESSANIMIATSNREAEAPPVPSLKSMTKSIKLIEDGVICTESIQDYVQENNEFLVVGIVGSEGVGKSTILNLLAHNKITPDLSKALFKSEKKDVDDEYECDRIKILTEHIQRVDLKGTNDPQKEIFKIANSDDLENACNRTQGIDIFITPNRLILLDCQALGSITSLEDLIKSENKRTNLVSEFIPLENSGEIQSLQLTTFLLSVCHVLLFVQDWFFDSNIIRFLHTAEMLKPTIPNPEEELTDHFPHLMLIHNKALMEDFDPSKFEEMQKTYLMLLNNTKLNKHDMSSGMGKLARYLDDENIEPLNLFLIPDMDFRSKSIYTGHPPLEELVKKLRAEILGVTRNPLTHVQLSEKTWLTYCYKVWETVKKSPFFVEYTKLMP